VVAETHWLSNSYKKDMKRYFLKLMIVLNRMSKMKTHKVDVDTVINENMSLMKEIRAKRIRFYKFSHQAETYLTRN
jgi:hypothetical protein